MCINRHSITFFMYFLILIFAKSGIEWYILTKTTIYNEITQEKTMRQRNKETPEQFEARREATEAKNAREATIFQMACIRRGLTLTTGAKTFKVSNQTFWAWMKGKHKVPHSAFVRLVELENQMLPEQFERIKDIQERADRMGITLFTKPKRRGRKKQPQKPTSEE